MAFQLSPGVQVKEVDLTSLIPAVATTRAGFAGHFQWGPVGQRITVSGETELVSLFQEPDTDTASYFFTAANFLGYGNSLQVARVVGSGSLNSVGRWDGVGTGGVLIKNEENYDLTVATAGYASDEAAFIAKYPSEEYGNSLLIAASDTTNRNFNFGSVNLNQGTNALGANSGLTNAGSGLSLTGGFAFPLGGNLADGSTATNSDTVFNHFDSTLSAITGDKVGFANGLARRTVFSATTLGTLIDNGSFGGAAGSKFSFGVTAHSEAGATFNKAIFAIHNNGGSAAPATGLGTGPVFGGAVATSTAFELGISGSFNEYAVGEISPAAPTPSITGSAVIFFDPTVISAASEYSIGDKVAVGFRVPSVGGQSHASEQSIGVTMMGIGQITKVSSGGSFAAGDNFIEILASEEGGAGITDNSEFGASADFGSVFNLPQKLFEGMGAQTGGSDMAALFSLDSIQRIGEFQLETDEGAAGGTLDGSGNTASVEWKYTSSFSQALPAASDYVSTRGGTNDLVHVAVVDQLGAWTGTPGTILETFESVSKAPNAKDFRGRSIYYVDRINNDSSYVWWGDHPPATALGSTGQAWGTDAADSGSEYKTLNTNVYSALTGGALVTPTDFFTDGYNLFEDAETVDVNLLLGGPLTGVEAKNLVALAEDRKDAVAFLSPPTEAVVDKTARVATANAVAYRTGVNASDSGGDFNGTSNNLNTSSSYGFLDSGYKYMYDRYNDVNRYVPLNGDVAGIVVRSDDLTDPWFSPAGFNRGQVRGVVRLGYNPIKSQRDDLYVDQINPVVSFPGEGTVLFGDKTLQSKPSAFDRINVRRLFIVLEKAIATASKFQLFEQNDAFTRAQFINIVEPFLRDVQTRRGITDFKVVCDDTNNTSQVIDANEFVADIFIQPTRSINFITLNFVATRTGVNFDEIGSGL